MTLFVGDDWAETHHDVHLMSETGERLAAKRLPEGLAGLTAFHRLIGDHAKDPCDVVIGIETERGLWVQALVAAGYQVYAINPLSVSRYRDRHSVGGAKSDAADAKVRSGPHSNAVAANATSTPEPSRSKLRCAHHRSPPQLQ